MAGHDMTPGVPNFDPVVYRQVIKQTMHMGVPEDLDKRLVWHFNIVKSYDVQDPALKPYDWTAPPTMAEPSEPEVPGGEIIVDYALEFSRGTEVNTELGSFDTSKLIITMLDVDFEKVRRADWATIGRVFYDIDFTGPPMGLFEVTVYQVYLTARDQA